MLAEFNAARVAEWTEFTAECGHFHAKITKERRKAKLTVAELDEEIYQAVHAPLGTEE